MKSRWWTPKTTQLVLAVLPGTSCTRKKSWEAPYLEKTRLFKILITSTESTQLSQFIFQRSIQTVISLINSALCRRWLFPKITTTCSTDSIQASILRPLLKWRSSWVLDKKFRSMVGLNSPTSTNKTKSATGVLRLTILASNGHTNNSVLKRKPTTMPLELNLWLATIWAHLTQAHSGSGHSWTTPSQPMGHRWWWRLPWCAPQQTISFKVRPVSITARYFHLLEPSSGWWLTVSLRTMVFTINKRCPSFNEQTKYK